MFEDFLINGKSASTLDDSMSNNMMSEDSLLNNIVMRQELASGIIVSENSSVSDNSVNSVFSVGNCIKMSAVESNGAIKPTDKMLNKNSFPVPVSQPVRLENNFLMKKDGAIHMESIETQTSADHNFSSMLKTEMKLDERNITTKNMTLAELLEKSTDKKDPPILNGALRIGEKGLELITKDESTRTYKTTNLMEKSVICSNKKVRNSYLLNTLMYKFY